MVSQPRRYWIESSPLWKRQILQLATNLTRFCLNLQVLRKVYLVICLKPLFIMQYLILNKMMPEGCIVLLGLLGSILNFHLHSLNIKAIPTFHFISYLSELSFTCILIAKSGWTPPLLNVPFLFDFTECINVMKIKEIE